MSWRSHNKSGFFYRQRRGKEGLGERVATMLSRTRQSNLKSFKAGDNTRIRILSVIFLIAGLVMVGRLFDLQILRGSFYTALAADQHELYQKLFPERGSIYVVEDGLEKKILYPLVTNKTMYVVYASPKEIIDATTTAEKVLEILGMPKNNDERSYAESNSSSSDLFIEGGFLNEADREKYDLLKKWIDNFLQKEKAYYPLRERVEMEQIEKLDALDLPGIGWSEKSYRYYTERGGGQLLGFWGYNGNERVGRYGIEGYYDELLAGKMGEIRSERDTLGNMIALGTNEFKEKIDGADLVLTINRAIQFKACEALKASVEKNKAKSGTVVVMNPKTGEIISMCSVPDFDPDKYYEVENPDIFNNKAIFDAYEPGSVFKPVTMAGAIDSGAVSPSTMYEDTGWVDYGDHKIKNFENKSYGYVSMTKVLEYSINTGMIFSMRQMGVEKFVNYVKNFGFGEKTNIELHKEVAGNIKNLESRGEINKATATFGQGIAVTPIQMLTAFCAVINGGKLMKPYIVSQVIRNNEVIETTQPETVRQVISPKTSLTMKAMLVSVVENGHVKKAQIPGYRVGGKTGTAQVPNRAGGYFPNDVVIGSFVGFAPYNDPKIAILVRIDMPQSNRTGEGVAVPVFVDIAKFALQYYNIPKDKQQ